jgi:drug/metabolite transporter, DME family
MMRVSRPPDPIPLKTPFFTPARSGMIYCVLAALGYAATNVCLRKLAVLRCDPTWVVFNKELVTVLVIGPWLLAQTVRRRLRLPSWKVLGMILLTGLMVQLAGNLALQWSLGAVGLAVAVPVNFGLKLLSVAVFGWWILHEAVSLRAALVIGLLLAALILLSSGAEGASSSIAATGSPPNGWLIIGALAAAGASGVSFALLSIVIRHTLRRTTPTGILVLLIAGTGVATLGPISYLQSGWEIAANTTTEEWAWILAAGIFNLLAFLSISKGLQLTPVVHANILNASQVAMAALAGVFFFHEAFPVSLMLGVSLTIVGILLADRPPATDEIVEAGV